MDGDPTPRRVRGPSDAEILGIKGGLTNGLRFEGFSRNLLLMLGCFDGIGISVGSPGGALRLVSRLAGTDSMSVTVDELKDGPVADTPGYISAWHGTRMRKLLQQFCCHFNNMAECICVHKSLLR